MKYFVCFLSVIASVQASNINRLGWSTTTTTTLPPTTAGWAPTTTEAPTEAPTPGWAPTTEAPTEAPTTGWPAPPPPTTTPGWPAPPPPGWAPPPPSSISVDLTGELAAVGAGSASQNHAELVLVHGDDAVPAELLLESAGEAAVVQEGSISQVASVTPDDAISINAVSVGQGAIADNGVSLIASGLDVLNQQSAAATAAGEGAEAAAATTSIVIS